MARGSGMRAFRPVNNCQARQLRQVPFALLLLFFNMGIIAASLIPELPAPGTIAVILLVAFLAAFSPLPSCPPRLHMIRLVCLALICGGVWSCGWGLWRTHTVLPADWQKKDLEAVGYVADLPTPGARRIRFVFVIRELRDPAGNLLSAAGTRPLPFRRVQLSWYDPPEGTEIAPGQKWRLTMRIRRPHSFRNPGGFDYESYMLQSGIKGQGYVRPKPAPRLLGESHRYPIAQLRWKIKRKFSQQSASSHALGLLNALMIGDRGEISAEDRLALRRNGISHLIAISGLHLSMVGGFIFGVLMFLFGRLHRLSGGSLFSAAGSPLGWAALMTLPLIGCYAVIAGFSLPTQRALIMLGIFLLLLLCGRFYRLLNIYVLAMAAVLMINPLAALGAGFWLSFAAAGFILLASRRLGGASAGPAAGPLAFFRSLLFLQVSLVFCLAPFILFFFYEFSIAGIFVNLIAIPLTTFVLMPWIFLTTFLLFVLPVLGELSLVPLVWLIDVCYDGLAAAASLPRSYVHLPRPSALAIVCAVVGVIFWLCRRSAADALLAILFFLPLFFPADKSLAPGKLEVTFLDVGQGLATYLRTANHRLIYDTGASFSARSSAGSLVIAPYLSYLGGADPDRIIVSHRDRDHSGGLEDLLERTRRTELMLNFPLPNSRFPILPCQAGQSWRWDGVLFELLYPVPGKRSKNRNDNSCVLRVTAGEHRLLLTGDLTQKAEEQFLAAVANATADLLQVPHHGSAGASGERLVLAVRPLYAVFAAGYLNPYGHPHADIVRRYASIGSVPLILWQTGAATFELGGEKITYNRGYRVINKRYWHLNYDH